jgi:hypothetical protein
MKRSGVFTTLTIPFPPHNFRYSLSLDHFLELVIAVEFFSGMRNLLSSSGNHKLAPSDRLKNLFTLHCPGSKECEDAIFIPLSKTCDLIYLPKSYKMCLQVLRLAAHDAQKYRMPYVRHSEEIPKIGQSHLTHAKTAFSL